MRDILQQPVNVSLLKHQNPSGYIIYCIQNTENDKVYIGQTKQCLRKRLDSHRRNPPKRMAADFATAKGSDDTWPASFRVYVLDIVFTSREANAVETKFIVSFKSNTSMGYNNPLLKGHPFVKGVYQRRFKSSC